MGKVRDGMFIIILNLIFISVISVFVTYVLLFAVLDNFNQIISLIIFIMFYLYMAAEAWRIGFYNIINDLWED